MRLSHALFIALAIPAQAFSERVWPDTGAMGQGQIYENDKKYFERLVFKKQTELVEKITTDSIREINGSKYPDQRLVDAVADLHTSWLAYYPKECELIGALSGAGGSWPSTYATRCEANLVYRRFNRLKAAMNCIDRIPERQRPYSLSQCLYQLSPLTYGKES